MGQGLGVIMSNLAASYSIAKSLDRKPILYLDALKDTLFSDQQMKEDKPGYSEQEQTLLHTFPNISKHFEIEEKIPQFASPHAPKTLSFNTFLGLDDLLKNLKASDALIGRSAAGQPTLPSEQSTLTVDVSANRFLFERDLDFFREELFVFSDEILEKTKPYVIDRQDQSIALSLRLEYYLHQKKHNRLTDHTALSPEYYSKALENFSNVAFPYGVVVFVFCDFPNESSDFIDEIFFANGVMALMGNKFNASELLCIFSQCKHAVLSNSAFAFWGAALNKNQRAKIICPKNYMKDCPWLNGRWYLPEWEALEQV